MEDSLIARIASHPILETAFSWLCKQQHDYSPHNDVWDPRMNWGREKLRIQADLLAEEFF